MKKIFTLTIVIMQLCFSLRTLAESAVGNGGDGIVCRDANKNVISIELLDYYEARTQRGIQYDLGSSHLNPMVKITLALNRLKRLSPLRAQMYSDQVAKFFDDALMLKGVQLVDVPDSQHIQVPKGCAIEQLVIQHSPVRPEDKRYIINADLWDLLDSDNKAGLILHEIIYQEAISDGQDNSIATRYFNSLYTSKKINKLSLEDYLLFLKNNGFKKSDINGVWFGTETIKLSKNALLVSATPLFGEINVNGSSVKLRKSCEVLFNNGKISEFYPQEYKVKIPSIFGDLTIFSYDYGDPCTGGYSSRIEIYTSGKLKSANLLAPTEFKSGDTVFKINKTSLNRVSFYENGLMAGGELIEPVLANFLDGKKREIRAGLFQIDEKGIVVYGILKEPSSFLIQGKEVLFGLEVRFHSKGYLWKGRLAKSERLKNDSGEIVLFSSNSKIEFDENGLVVTVTSE